MPRRIRTRAERRPRRRRRKAPAFLPRPRHLQRLVRVQTASAVPLRPRPLLLLTVHGLAATLFTHGNVAAAAVVPTPQDVERLGAHAARGLARERVVCHRDVPSAGRRGTWAGRGGSCGTATESSRRARAVHGDRGAAGKIKVFACKEPD